MGTNSQSIITGTGGADTLLGGFGDDTISGLAGNDTIDGQAGNDTIFGGDGSDALAGNYGNDTLYGEAGDDTLSDDQGTNYLDGGDGNDTLSAVSLTGNQTLVGGAGYDILNATGQVVSLGGGAGDDYLTASGQLRGSNYQTIGSVVAGIATLSGDAGNDVLNVSYYSSATLSGGDGDDYLSAASSRSATLSGDAGKDSLTVNYDASSNDGNVVKDKAYVLDGGADDDILSVRGSSYNNNYSGNYAGKVSAVLRGGTGNDQLSVIDNYAGTGTVGSSSNYYGVAQASLDGGEGSDVLTVAGVLQATLTGGAGADVFKLMAQQYKTMLEGDRHFMTEAGSVTLTPSAMVITDFSAGTGGDVLDYSDLLRNAVTSYDGSNPFATGYLKLTQSGADTLLQIDADGSAGAQSTPLTLAVLHNVTASTLTSANFNPNYPPVAGIVADVNHVPTGAVTIGGIAVQGQALTASNTLADADGLGVISYQWKANGLNIGGATTNAYTLSAAEIGKTVTVQASYTDGGHTLETVTSAGLQVASYTNSVNENTKLVTKVTSSDLLIGSAPKFLLSGADAALFKISSNGVLYFVSAHEYELPTDIDQDGAYNVSVTMTNVRTHYAVTQNLVVGVNFAEIDGTTGADTLKGTKGWDTLDGKAGDDVLTGGDGLDTFIISAGHDTVKDFNVLGKTWTGPGAEVLHVTAGASVSATLKAAWSATSDTFNFGDALITTSGLAVDLSGVTSGAGWDVLNKGKATTLTGSMFDDTLTAGAGNDVLMGGGGDDTLIGTKLADTMTGGTGSDIFQLNGLKGIATAHHITDFVSGQDHIQLDSKIFKALGLGALVDSAWVDGTTATNSNQHIIYNSSNGELFYDVDGSGKKAAVLIGVVDNHAALTHGDFLVV
jgi:Ca2+-binding RTX toxin-like protein